MLIGATTWAASAINIDEVTVTAWPFFEGPTGFLIVAAAWFADVIAIGFKLSLARIAALDRRAFGLVSSPARLTFAVLFAEPWVTPLPSIDGGAGLLVLRAALVFVGHAEQLSFGSWCRERHHDDQNT